MPPLTAETVPDNKVDYRGLRGWLDEVSRMGELLQVNGAHWGVEMGALTHMLTEKSSGTAPAILFDDIPGYPKGFRTLYGHFSSIRRIAFEHVLQDRPILDETWRQRYHHRMQELKLLPPRVVKDGPILQNVLEGDAVD